MNRYLALGAIHVKDVNLWSHVGVLEQERSFGQEFLLDFSLWLDLDRAAKKDDLSMTADYSLAIHGIQDLASKLNCNTLEYFSELILDCLESLYGSIPMEIYLRKCSAPVAGFSGTVGVERSRHLPSPRN